MKRHFLAAIAAVTIGTSAQAQDTMVEYFTILTPTDAFNSRGQPLDDICAIVQQDRANWHRFNKRDQADSADWFFDSPERRAMIAGNCEYDRSYFANAGARIRNGDRQFFVYVRVYGSNGQIRRVLIAEGAG